MLETKLKEPDRMDPEQALREYGLAGKDIDARLEELLEKSLREFEESAPDAVEPFRLMADLSNLKAFVRRSKKGEPIPYSALGTFQIPEELEDLRAKLFELGHPELADKLKELDDSSLRETDLYLENYFLGRITNPLFLEYLQLKRDYLKTDEAPKQFYSRLARFLKESSATKNMDLDVPTAFLLMKQRELELARARALKAIIGG